MLKKFLLLAVLTLLVCGPSKAMAQEAVWRLTSQTGQVRVLAPGQAVRPAHVNDVIPEGSVVITSAGASAVIDNGLQRMTMSANSRMTIARTAADGVTRIFQDIGEVLFQVDHRDAPHFRVETPLLAAIVKGTTFRVINHHMYDSVVVVDGLVEVDAKQGDARQDVPTGRAVSVSRNAPTQLSMGAGGGDGGLGGGDTAPTAQDFNGRAPNAANGLSRIADSDALLRRISDPEAGNDDFVKFFLAYLGACLVVGYLVFVAVGLTSDKSKAANAMSDRVMTPSERTFKAAAPAAQPLLNGNQALRNFLQRRTRK